MTAVGFVLALIGFLGVLQFGNPYNPRLSPSEAIFGGAFLIGGLLMAAGVAKILWDIML
jgi:hypothetical protein